MLTDKREIPMTESPKQNQRKTVYIKKEFQFRFILRFCLLIIAGVIVSTTLLFLLSQGTLTTSFQESRLVIKTTGIAILPSVIYTNLVTLVLITLCTILVTLFVSHKIAGPLVRLEKEIKEVGKGDLTREVKFRGNDQITELEETMNSTIAGLRGKVGDIRNDLDRIRQSASSQDVSRELIDQLETLHRKIEATFKI